MAGIIRRLRSNLNVVLSIAGIVASVVGTLLSAIPLFTTYFPRWLSGTLILVTFLTLILFIVALTRRPRIVANTKRYLSPLLVEEVIKRAIDPELNPICWHPSVNHACGAALTALAAKEVRHGLVLLYNLLDVIILEMRQEHRYTLQSAVTHLQKVAMLFHGITALTRTLSSRQCFRLDDAEGISRVLVDASRHVQNEGIDALLDLLRRAPSDSAWAREHPLFRLTIKTALKEEIPMSLEKLRGRMAFPSANSDILRIINHLGHDWHSCVRHVWRDSLCQPT